MKINSRKSARKSARKSSRKTSRKSVRKSSRKTSRKSVRKAARKVTDILEEVEGKAIIWARWRQDIDSIVKAIEKEYPGSVMNYGALSTEDRAKAIKAIQDPNSKVRFLAGLRVYNHSRYKKKCSHKSLAPQRKLSFVLLRLCRAAKRSVQVNA